MSGLQKQIADLNRKVEQLHKAVERLSQQISLLAPGEDGSIEIEVLETVIASESIHDVSCPSVLFTPKSSSSVTSTTQSIICGLRSRVWGSRDAWQ